MPQEIERKFLVKNDTWRQHVERSECLRDGLLAASDGRKVRVRLYESRATLTVKSRREHGRRAEFEYDIPRDHAEEMLELHCGNCRIDKTRYYVPFAGLVWEVDVYDSPLAGVVLAEVELDRIDRDVPLPEWTGEEVTDRPEYKKSVMLAAVRNR
jgi:adenylate cyclase